MFALEYEEEAQNPEGISLSKVSLRLPLGSIFALIGPEGEGKTRLIRSFLGLHPQMGKVSILGHSTLPEALPQVATLLPETSLPLSFTPKQAGRFLSQIFPSWNSAHFIDKLNLYQIPLKKPISSLEPEEKILFSLACALAQQPKLLLFDLGFSLHSQDLQDRLQEEFTTLVQDQQASLLLTARQVEDLPAFPNLYGFLSQGSLVATGTPKDLLANFALTHCQEDQLPLFPPGDVLRRLPEGQGYQLLIPDRFHFFTQHPTFPMESLDLQQLSHFLEKGDCNDK